MHECMEIGLEVRRALVWCKDVELFSASAPVSSHAPFVFAHHFSLPMVGDPGLLKALQELVAPQGITHLFPARDDELLALAEHAHQLAAKSVTSPLETCRVTRSKSATLRVLQGIVPTPKLFLRPEEVSEFPVFLRPDRELNNSTSTIENEGTKGLPNCA